MFLLLDRFGISSLFLQGGIGWKDDEFNSLESPRANVSPSNDGNSTNNAQQQHAHEITIKVPRSPRSSEGLKLTSPHGKEPSIIVTSYHQNIPSKFPSFEPATTTQKVQQPVSSSSSTAAATLSSTKLPKQPPKLPSSSTKHQNPPNPKQEKPQSHPDPNIAPNPSWS
jgi:hypothetical protein